MEQFDFDLTFSLSAYDRDHNAIIERLGAAGCTDATIGIGREGCVVFAYTKAAASLEAAIALTVNDVLSVIPSAELSNVEPHKRHG